MDFLDGPPNPFNPPEELLGEDFLFFLVVLAAKKHIVEEDDDAPKHRAIGEGMTEKARHVW